MIKKRSFFSYQNKRYYCKKKREIETEEGHHINPKINITQEKREKEKDIGIKSLFSNITMRKDSINCPLGKGNNIQISIRTNLQIRNGSKSRGKYNIL